MRSLACCRAGSGGLSERLVTSSSSLTGVPAGSGEEVEDEDEDEDDLPEQIACEAHKPLAAAFSFISERSPAKYSCWFPREIGGTAFNGA